MKVLLVVNPQKAASQTLALEIKTKLEERGITVNSFSWTDKALPQEDFELAISLGGDGTVLFTARTIAARKVPILPVNLGTLGFIASVPPVGWLDAFEIWRAGKAVFSQRLMLEIAVERRGKRVFELPAMNDAVISASGIAKTIRLRVHFNGQSIARYRSDGLIAATPTGSTAYSASAGGPILDPEMEAIILNPVCPFTLFKRPLVLPITEPVQINIEHEQRSGVLLTIDGQVTEALENGDFVFVSAALNKTQLIVSGRSAFYNALHTKLSHGT
ncbi:MAG: NAD(+)/NADH kinase [Spirochaetaceae bacterium]|jgi:NAD+ kinase|nr:NAD(+)/NADH kinase [Spirochaetaceae bacterium]GMO30319.1 MAG: NAD(+)/NADH kinase [Termitinemataceae bacterium]